MMCISKIKWTGVLAIKSSYYFLQAIHFLVAWWGIKFVTSFWNGVGLL